MPRVLVIEDDPDVGLLLSAALGTDGHTADVAENGTRGLDLMFDGLEPDVVLLDVQMPNVDGWETLRRIRADRRTMDVPVLLCTVKSSGSDIMRGWELGCDGYIAKPFDIGVVLDEVRNVVGLSATARAARREHALEELKRNLVTESRE